MSPLEFLTLSLATFYTADALVKRHGPFGVFAALRNRFARSENALLNCTICTAVWAAAGLYLISLWAWFPVVILAAAGAAVALRKYTGMDYV